MQGFINVRACLPGQGIVRTNIGFENGKIAYIGPDASGITPLFETDALVLPGFIEEHIHGAGGSDTMDGTVEDLKIMSRQLAREGVTGFLAGTITQSVENISKALSAVREARETRACDGAELLGVHLEGPFISPDRVGAQPKEHVAAPSIEVFDRYYALSGESIRIVTVAPELPGALELIRHLRDLGVVASMGHSVGKFADVEAAVEAGASCVTHMYNGLTGLHHREIGVVGGGMLLDDVYCELICDTIHVSVPAMRLVAKVKPADKVILITDALRAKGLGEGPSELGGQTVFVRGGAAYLPDGTLAGSATQTNRALGNLVTLAGVPLPTAVGYASLNPARNLGFAAERGSIEIGKRADFALLADDFETVATVVGGRVVYRA